MTWHSNGKLLLTGEYLVLEGAKALAIPINKGQNLKVQKKTNDFPVLEWEAFQQNKSWFQARFRLPELTVTDTSHPDMVPDLQKLLKTCQKMSPGFLDGSESFRAETNLEFDSGFGFGSSSTLVSNLAYWADVDPFALQRTALGGSGYDVACARSQNPLLYQLAEKSPVTKEVTLSFPFVKSLYFVYLGQKQRTEESISAFRQHAHFGPLEIEQISQITQSLPAVKNLDEFEKLLEEHEQIMSSVLGIVSVKKRLFPEFQGMVKSLGAWGGDFVLMTRHSVEADFKNYLSNKGYNTFYSWDELLLK